LLPEYGSPARYGICHPEIRQPELCTRSLFTGHPREGPDRGEHRGCLAVSGESCSALFFQVPVSGMSAESYRQPPASAWVRSGVCWPGVPMRSPRKPTRTVEYRAIEFCQHRRVSDIGKVAWRCSCQENATNRRGDAENPPVKLSHQSDSPCYLPSSPRSVFVKEDLCTKQQAGKCPQSVG